MKAHNTKRKDECNKLRKELKEMLLKLRARIEDHDYTEKTKQLVDSAEELLMREPE
jgi:ElaB/YqjD/DUF883 family membrane-anchored ribosome-binding protein